jgi:hypothetical protein
MYTALILAIMPYCTPQQNPAILSTCIDWMIACMAGDLNNEEMCSESLPLQLEGKG